MSSRGEKMANIKCVINTAIQILFELKDIPEHELTLHQLNIIKHSEKLILVSRRLLHELCEIE